MTTEIEKIIHSKTMTGGYIMKEKNIQELAIHMGLVTVEDMCQYTIAQLVVKIANKVNELVNEVWRFETDVQEILKTHNENIQYLLGEGLHLEVENIFDGWIQDGTFDILLNQTTLKKVNDRIDETYARLSDIERDKADKLDVFLKENGININDFDEETRRTFLEAQGIDVNYVLGKDNVTRYNIAPKSIDESKISRILVDGILNSKIVNINNGYDLSLISTAHITSPQTIQVVEGELVWNIGASTNYTYVMFDIDLSYLKENDLIHDNDYLDVGVGQYRTGLKTSDVKIAFKQLNSNNVMVSETTDVIGDDRDSYNVSYYSIKLSDGASKLRVMIDIGGVNESLELHFTSLCIVNDSIDLFNITDYRIVDLMQNLKDSTLPSRMNSVTTSITEGTEFSWNNNELNISVGDVANVASWYVDYDVSDYSNGDILEVVLKYKTASPANKNYRVKARIDLATDDYFQLYDDGKYHEYKKYYTVGKDVTSKIRLMGLYSSPNVNDYLSQAYVRKYNKESYKFDLIRESLYDYVKTEQEKENLKLNGKTNVLEVNCAYTGNEDGFGITKFKDLISAHRSINNANAMNRYIIKVHPGTYKEWENVWSGSSGECDWGPYKGIVIKNHVYFESTDINHPENYILEWDGHVGYDESYQMTVAECMEKALFHISRNGTNTHIKGFTLRSKNTRYCIHPESAGNGKGGNWTIENCIVDWNGRPNCVDNKGGNPIGIGISAEETGIIKNCKILKNGEWSGNIAGHNNGYNVINNGEKDFITHGATLIIEDCVFNGGNIVQYTEKNDIDTVDSMIVRGCSGINTIQIAPPKSGIKNTWTLNVENSEYTLIDMYAK